MKKIIFSAFILLSSMGFSQTYFTNFEDGYKDYYGSGDIVLNGKTWTLRDALILPNEPYDFYYGTRSLRIRNSANGLFRLQTAKPNGLGVLDFYYRSYGDSNSNDITVSQSFRIDYAANGGAWTEIAQITTDGLNVKHFHQTLDIQGDIRIRFVSLGSTNDRTNIDNLAISDYGQPFLSASKVKADFFNFVKNTIVNNLLFLNNDDIFTVLVYDASGRLVKKTENVKTSVSLQDLKEGVYHVNVFNKNKEAQGTKIIKK